MQIIQRIPFTIHHFATLGSTNDYLKTLADAQEFTCVTADEQTAGRGRYTRAWHSAPGEGLYLSVLLRPKAAKVSLLSLAAASAVAETLQAHGGSDIDIKWPNDVLLGERKVCGILLEAVGNETSLRVIVGIGVNLNHTSFPSELSETATSLRLMTGNEVEVASFRDTLLQRVLHWYQAWQQDAQSIVQRWQELSSFAYGQEVQVMLASGQLSGVTSGLTDDGALRLRLPTGEEQIILAGDVMRLRRH